MKILVDMDGIVTDTLPAWLKRIYELTGVSVEPEKIQKWNLCDNPPLDKLDHKLIVDILNEKDFNINLPQMADATHYLKRLHDAGHDISIVTARHGITCISETIQWLEIMMPWFNVAKKTWFCYEKHRIIADVLIDDKAENLIEYRKMHPNAHLITIDYIFNKHAPSDTKRILKNGYEWEAIESYITKLSKKD